MKENSEIIKNWMQSLALLVAGAWVLYQFLYIEKIKPLNEEPYLSVELNMVRVGTVKPYNGAELLVAYRLSTTTTNPGKRKIFVASSYFQVHGDTIIKKENDYQLKKENLEAVLNNQNQLISKIYSTKDSDLIATGTLYNSDSWFSPGESITINRLVYLPEDNYAQVEANIFILFGADVRDLHVKQSVDSDYNVLWQLSEDLQNWMSIQSEAAMKLAGDRLTIVKANVFIPVLVDDFLSTNSLN